ncbi:hypothetical protein B0I26_10224 [Anoxybacillus vitaminiphilus]|uniref:Uncharacterized protein n=1 Tax=Paranoxybacillus vitaminiphilus TaxID=581036 RepID=A0A327YQS0_9BACL|nr:hypothetical protein B0I26_10224 [Anoxybacillus vitaminiphilus]
MGLCKREAVIEVNNYLLSENVIIHSVINFIQLC